MEAEKSGLSEQPVIDPRSIRLSDIDLSVRTANVLRNAGLAYLGEVALLTEGALLRFQNCGKKSVQEVKDVLESHGLELGSNGEWTNPPETPPAPSMPPKGMADYDDATRAKFFLTPKDLNLSPRATNAMTLADIKFVGELVQSSVGKLVRLPHCGRTSAEEIANKLGRLGLHFGMAISDWDRKIAETERSRNGDFIAAARIAAHDIVLPEASNLEDELEGYLQAFAVGRNIEMVAKFQGWTGGGRLTLETVGREYGITRERVRQIVARTVGKIKDAPISVPNLRRAVEAVAQVGPATPLELGKLLHLSGVSKGEFSPSGLASACEVFDIEFGLEKRHFGRTLIYGKPEALARLHGLFVHCRRLTSARGCVNFEAACDDAAIPASERDGARALISKTKNFAWLDDERHWIFAPTSRNRLINLILKVLSVAPKIHLSELRRAVGKSKRLEVVPPAAVLARFLEVTKLAKVDGNDVATELIFPAALEAGGSEEKMVRVLKQHGPIMAWDKFQEACIAEGMNPITIGIYLGNSPIVARVVRGVYALVGTRIAPGVAEEIAAESEKSRRPSEYGWTSRNTLWCAIPVNRNTLTSGSVNLPSFVTNMVDSKEWRVVFGGKQSDTVLKARNNFLWSLAKPLANLGADPGDICILDFDLSNQTVNLAIGGEELIDAWESGEIDLMQSPDQDLPDDVEVDELDDTDRDLPAEEEL